MEQKPWKEEGSRTISVFNTREIFSSVTIGQPCLALEKVVRNLFETVDHVAPLEDDEQIVWYFTGCGYCIRELLKRLLVQDAPRFINFAVSTDGFIPENCPYERDNRLFAALFICKKFSRARLSDPKFLAVVNYVYEKPICISMKMLKKGQRVNVYARGEKMTVGELAADVTESFTGRYKFLGGPN